MSPIKLYLMQDTFSIQIERDREKIIRANGGDKVSKSNLATCDPISAATLCVCTEHVVSFGIDQLFPHDSPFLTTIPEKTSRQGGA